MHAASATAQVQSAAVSVGPQALPAILDRPAKPVGLVVFAHGAGSSRHSPRNRHVASILQSRGLCTLRLDLLTEDEAADRSKVFDIELLARRLEQALDWAGQTPAVAALGVGLFGASTGAAAALVAAAAHPLRVAAVVSRGGRPDLAGVSLERVQAPTLLIVGGDDRDVLALNRAALRSLRCSRRLEVIAGATHLFEEAGALDSVAAMAADWFTACLPRAGQALAAR